MNCEEASKVDLVNDLYLPESRPAKIKCNKHWCLSPFSNQQIISSEVYWNKNLWYEHWAINYSALMDFVIQYYNYGQQTRLQKTEIPVADKKPELLLNNSKKINETASINNLNGFNSSYFSFQQQTHHQINALNNETDRPFHLYENCLIDEVHAAEPTIQIRVANQSNTNPSLYRHLKERCINKNIIYTCCHVARFVLNNEDREYVDLGFKKNADGYELRNELFKLRSASKYVIYVVNSDSKKVPASEDKQPEISLLNLRLSQPKIDEQNHISNAKIHGQSCEQNHLSKQAKLVAVFKEFFDYPSSQSIYQNQQYGLTNFLMLNSLIFFERSLLLIEKHSQIHLYSKNTEPQRKCVGVAQRHSSKHKDESRIYEEYKDLNDWVVHFGQQPLGESRKMRFP